MWVMEIQTQVFALAWQVFYSLSLLPSPHLVTLFITSCGNSILFSIVATPAFIFSDNIEIYYIIYIYIEHYFQLHQHLLKLLSL